MAMEFTRRQFFGGLSALLATASAKSYAAATGAGRPNLKFGVLSDIHISPIAYMERFLGGDRASHRVRETDLFERALRYFDEQGADGVLIAGDIADWGLVGQLQAVADCWYKVFPNGRSARDGRKVEQLFALGNHDFEGFNYGYAKKACGQTKIPKEEILATDMAANWERIFHEPYRPIWQKEVKGYTFIGGHWVSWKGIDGIEAYMKEHGPALKGTRPFFYAQHAHPGNTVGGPWAWGNDGGRATKLLSAYPNAVAFSGHSHYSLTDERTIWQGAFTSVGTSSLRYIYAQVGRENGENWGSRGTRPLQMPSLPESQGEQGLLMTVSSDRITFARRDILNGKSLGPDWVVPLDGTKPYAFAPRKAAAVAPEFAPGAKAEVRKVKGKDRSGVELEQVVVSFPAAQPSRTSRVYEYEVRASLADIEDVREPVCVRRVLAEGFYLAPEDDAKTATCVIDASLFPPKNNIIFEIRPLDCFGNAGKPLTRVW